MLKIIGIGAFIILLVFTFFNTNKVGTVEFIEKIEKISIVDFNGLTGSGVGVIDPEIVVPEVKHIETPSSVKSVYFTAGAMGYEPKKKNLIELIDNYEINSVIIDVKTVSGYTSFKFEDSFSGSIQPTTNNQIKDIKLLIEELHEKGVYVIARVVVFKDKLLAEKRPDLAVKRLDNSKTWEDYKGNKYLDPSSKEVWDYNIELAIKSYELGFDEINFDYVRFPTDGNISNTYFPFSKNVKAKNPKFNKIKVLDNFSTYLSTKIKEKNPEIIISADVFGLVSKSDVYNIGQNLESFVMNFDYVSPMVYPSHYGPGYLGYKNPDDFPYEILTEAFTYTNKKIDKLNSDIKQASLSGTVLTINNGFVPSRELKTIENEIPKTVIRPWIQGFSCTRCRNYTSYTRNKFRKQIKAITDAGLNSYFVWSSGSNYYREWYNKKEEAITD